MENLFMSKHDKFILTPITKEIDDALSATRYIGDGIETFPLSKYVMHSLFLNMTGFQEQKMKCIVWEMATDDFNFRRELLYELKLGEYSDYKAKKTIYEKIIKIIQKRDESFELKNLDKNKIETKLADMKNSFMKTNISKWYQKSYYYFYNNVNKIIVSTQFLNSKNNLLESELQKYYVSMYEQRNRLAHNVNSYQQNSLSLIKLKNEDEGSRNYFIWFAILVLIDTIFIELYKKYEEVINGYIY